jgi:hypothetical protein
LTRKFEGCPLQTCVSIYCANHIYYHVLILQFAAGGHLCFMNKDTLGKQHLEQCEYTYLKSMHMTRYKGAGRQLEFLLHIVQNAPVLEELIVETAIHGNEDDYARIYCRSKPCSERVALHTRSCLSRKLSPKVKLCVM